MGAIAQDLQALADQVARAAAGRFPAHRVVELEVLPGGHSGLTHVATFAGAEPGFRAVVKSAPPGRPARGRHDVLRQARVLRALRRAGAAVPVPEVLFESDSPVALFGMTLVDGRAAEPVLEDARPEERADHVAGAWRDAVEVLAAFDGATPEALGLSDEPVTTPADEVERWSAAMRSAGLDADARAVEAARRLGELAPPCGPPRIVHGDFRLGNMIQRDGRVAALIDWEIWSLGDPRCDLGWLTLFADATAFPRLGRAAPGTPSPQAVVDRYLTLTGRDPDAIGWFRALACFKFAAIQAHNLQRHRKGRYRDPHHERMSPAADLLLDRALDLLG